MIGAKVEPLVIAWVHPGEVNGRFMDSVLGLFYADRERAHKHGTTAITGTVWVESGPRIAHSRNLLVRRFLSNAAWAGTEWLLMLDADMTFSDTLLDNLFDGVRDDKGNLQRLIVGGLCFGGGHNSIVPTMYQIVDPKENGGSPVRVITEWDDGDVVPVDATGAACLLVHRSVYEHFATTYGEPVPFFAESVYGGVEFGEDWTFCMRAMQQKIPIVVNTAAKLGHMKLIQMDENSWRGGSNLTKIEGYSAGKKLATVTPITTPNRKARRNDARKVKV